MSDNADSVTEDYDYLIKLLALGDSSVGKTCILHRYIDNAYSQNFGNTVGVDFKQKQVVYRPRNNNGIIERDAKLNLQLWDTAGQERFKSLTVSFFRDAMGFLLVFDLTDEQSFIDLRDWLRLLKINSYCETPDIVLVGNKKDLVANRTVSYDSVASFAKEIDVPYIETSASTGENIEQAFTLLIDLVMERINKVVDKSFLPVKKKPNVVANEQKPNTKCAC